MSSVVTLPALIDCHVHFREPGFTHKATMESESAAATAGGVHTVCDMPNTNPPCVTVEALKEKIAIANMQPIDIRLFFGITEAAHLEELKTAWNDPTLRKHLCGVKLYLDHSTGNQKVDGGIVEEIFKVCAELRCPLVAHCEDSDINEQASALLRSKGDKDVIDADVSLHSLMRPSASEAKSIEYAIGLAKKHGTQFHIAHMSTAAGVDLVRAAKADGISVTCEVAPHHLFLSLEDYDRVGTLGKMNPPLRTKADQEALWRAVEDGTVDCIATDHAPHTLEEKQTEPPLSAPSGVPGVETMLPLLLTRLEPQQIKTLCFENPNHIFSLGKSESDDQIHIDLDQEWIIKGEDLHGKCRWTPYENWQVRGRIIT